jgi:hypothetical protein
MIRPCSNLSGPILEGSKTIEIEIYPGSFRVDRNFKNISIAEVKMVRHQSGKSDNAEVYRTIIRKK